VLDDQFSRKEALVKKTFAGLTMMGLLFAAPALAADVAVKAPRSAPPMRAFTWTGCYLGGHGAAGWGRKQAADPAAIFAGVPALPLTIDPKGWLIGAQAGCDDQFAGNLVVGIEGAFSGGNIKGNTTLAIPFGIVGDSEVVSAKLDALGAVTGRLGYAIDRTLLYVKGGFAWANEQYSAVGVLNGAPFDLEGPESRFGWTAGGGLDWAFSDYYSIGLEYDYYNFGHHAVTFNDVSAAPIGLVITLPIDVRQTIQVVRLGVTFHMFATPATPVVTKY
jgi:outer membrane immunogenic protein